MENRLGRRPSKAKLRLAVAPSVEPPAAVEPCTPVEACASLKATTACVAAVIAAADKAARRSASVSIAWPIAIARPVAISGPIAVARTIIAVPGAAIIAASVVTAIPGSGTNKHASNKVAGPVITVGCAGIRIVAVVTIRTDRRRPNTGVHRAYSNAHSDLGACISCGKEQNPQQCNKFEITHDLPRFRTAKLPGNLTWGGSLHLIKPGIGRRVAMGVKQAQ